MKAKTLMAAMTMMAAAGDSMMFEPYSDPVIGTKKKNRRNWDQRQQAKAIQVEKRRAAKKRAKASKKKNRR
jgi:hypothetical protein